MEEILKVKNLKTIFKSVEGNVRAVDGVSFSIKKDEAIGIVGETGSGKSVTAKSIMLNVPDYAEVTADELTFEGINLFTLSRKDLQKIWGKKITMIFQTPTSYINPLFTIEKQMTDVICHHEGIKYAQALKLAKEMLELVKMPDPDSVLKSYPHQLSGGMIQRVIIALSLSCNPSLLIADEPTTALDVTIQAQILKLLNDIKSRESALLLITHNLAIIAEICDTVAIMYAGKMVEKGPVGMVMKKSLHPYTIGLIKAIPRLNSDNKILEYIPGNIPSAINPPPGCRYSPRCPKAKPICFEKEPVMEEKYSGHYVACHFPDEPLERSST